MQYKLGNLFCRIPEWRMRRNMRYGYGNAWARRAEAHRRRSARNDASPFCRSEVPEITLKGPPSLLFSRPKGPIFLNPPCFPTPLFSTLTHTYPIYLLLFFSYVFSSFF